ncbi:hypothetical protein MPSEU_000660300 [Mayamaea pseudoterrestris]|nr:hypothetical protein MPSEU_000660300 [Mayamaea pseudoterrestris]
MTPSTQEDDHDSYTDFNHRVCLAVGSNLGNRFENIHKALQLLCIDDSHNTKTKLIQTSFLRETAPMYLSEQPHFLNGAVMLETSLSPRDMLQRIKSVETRLGRNINDTKRNGPRPVDLDIILYEAKRRNSDDYAPVAVNEPDLVVPHASMQEREFVLEPLMDLVGGDFTHPVLNQTLEQLLAQLRNDKSDATAAAVRVLALPRNRVIHLNETIVMGILNVTPDSFSDGGRWSSSVETAVQQALQMERDGAHVIDVGGESTRPGAKELDVNVELQRTVPVIRQLRNVSDIPISIDTRHAIVAKAAIDAGADIVNDVSGGQFDKQMLSTVAKLAVPMVLMHMRGTPETMQLLAQYENVVKDVADAMAERSAAAERAGVHRWTQVIDPGIGFAKGTKGNLQLLGNLKRLRSVTRNLPIMLGTSRKGFIGRLTGTDAAKDRDPGTIATMVAALCLDDSADAGCNLVRVHNVSACKQAMVVIDAIRMCRQDTNAESEE